MHNLKAGNVARWNEKAVTAAPSFGGQSIVPLPLTFSALATSR